MIIYTDAGYRKLGERPIYVCWADKDGWFFRANLPIKARSSTQAEYIALYRALEYLQGKVKQITVRNDNQTMVRTLQGRYVPGKSIRRYYELVKRKITSYSKFSIRWVPREKNLAGLLLEGKECF